MRRLMAMIALALAVPVLVVLGTGADGGGGGYRVRAIFDNVAAAVPGEDVKIAGAKVGVIDSMDVDKAKKAVVVLRIKDGRFAPFRQNATCTVRPQSLIGEKFVECNPGSVSTPPLARIRKGDGAGQHLLPLARTSSPVDLDLINNINRRPYRERLSILLNEFGTGLAGRGADLNEVIHRANPALRQTDRVLTILARQNRVLGRLAVDSDRALAPLAREKQHLAGFIVHAGDTAAATAERRDDISRGLQRLPPFLRELRPLMADLGDFSGQATPVATDLNRAGTDVSHVIERLGPFSRGAQPSLVSLGAALRTGRPAVLRTRPLVQDVGRFAKQARPLSRNLDALTASLDKTGGIERLMDAIYYGALVINGYDSRGHYQRANLLNNLCSTYQISTQEGCSARLAGTGSASSTNNAGVASTAQSAKATEATPGDASAKPRSLHDVILGGRLDAQGKKGVARVRRQDAAKESPTSGDPALDYLLGDD
jgi:virulence factor Mce-like protein